MSEDTTTEYATTWMEVFKFHHFEEGIRRDEALSITLTECLASPGWDNDPEETELFEFLARCWVYPSLRLKVRKALQAQFATKEYKDDFIGCIEGVKERIEEEAREVSGGDKKQKRKKKDQKKQADIDFDNIDHLSFEDLLI